VGEPFTIASAPPTFAFPTLHQIATEKLFLAVWTAPDAALPEDQLCQTTVRTEDAGATWATPMVLRGKESGGHSSIQLKDGRHLWLSYFTRPVEARTLSCWVGRSSDGRSFAWSAGRVSFPQAVRPWEQGNAFMMFARSIVELADDSLVATLYGYFEGDGSKYRCVLVRSTDGGANWEYLSTIAHDPQAPAEGYCEPVLCRTTDGDLLCVMRVGSGLPMWSCRSGDDGRTWSQPTQLPPRMSSVFPDAVLMSNGVLAVSFGRPGTHIAFSVDGKGERWASRTTVYADTEPPSTCAYTAIREVAPGRLLYAYSFLENLIKPGALSYIRGVFVDVKRK
jgi:hypothetical protein